MSEPEALGAESRHELRHELRRRLLDGDFNCEKELTLSLISGKWKIVIIWHLCHEGPMRFGALIHLFKKCSHRIMTKQLRELEYDGLISRQSYEGLVAKVEYSLTELGMTITPIVDMMWSWGIEHMPFYAKKVQAEFDAAKQDAESERQGCVSSEGRTPLS
jgi:DNA-binding HxlR family transcriptional regulator